MAARTAVGVVAGTVVGVGVLGAGLYWLLSRVGADGGGKGFGLGGGGGDSLLGTKPPSGPSETEGDGGESPEDRGSSNSTPGDDRGEGENAGSGQGSKEPSAGSGEGSPDKGGSGGGGTSGGGGQGGGGVGGGSGGGVGSDSGSGTAGGLDDEGGSTGDEGGGGEDEGPYDPWGGLLIEVDLPSPDLSAAKLAAVRMVVEDLVLGAVLDPGANAPDLPEPLHAFDPDYGGVLLFWADVALHYAYDLPHGRLDPDNPSHIPWINLWLDILAYVSEVEAAEVG